MNEPPEEKYADVLKGGYSFSDPGDEHYFIFKGMPGIEGKDIARIDLRDGTVTYDVPDAGREAAKIFWEAFGDYIKGQIKKEREGE